MVPPVAVPRAVAPRAEDSGLHRATSLAALCPPRMPCLRPHRSGDLIGFRLGRFVPREIPGRKPPLRAISRISAGISPEHHQHAGGEVAPAELHLPGFAGGHDSTAPLNWEIRASNAGYACKIACRERGIERRFVNR